jgi:5'(3')-deoxyribonucleotidase
MLLATGSAVLRVCCFLLCDFGLIAITDRQEHLFGEIQVTTFLTVVLKNLCLHNRVHGTTFFTESTKNALCEINVVARCAPRTIVSDSGLNRDGHGGTNRFAQLASNATLFSVFIATQSVKTPEPWAQGRALLWELYGDFSRKHVLACERKPLKEFKQHEAREKISQRK